MKLNNWLPQGSVLAALLFNIYIADMLSPTSRKFGYVDDYAIFIYQTLMEDTEITLSEDLHIMREYLRKCRLQSNLAET